MVPAGNVPTYGTESTRPSSIVGAQTNCGTISTGDRIVLQGGNYAYRTCTGTWSGTLESGAGMTPSKAFFYNNKTAATRTLVLAGEADTTGIGIPSVNVPAPASAGGSASVAYSWRDPRDRPRNTLNLQASGFRNGTISTSDRVVEQQGSYFYLSSSTNLFAGGLAGVTAGKAYFIVNKHFGQPAWGYQYLATGAAVTMPEGGAIRGDATTQKLGASPKVTPTVKTAPKVDAKPTTSTK